MYICMYIHILPSFYTDFFLFFNPIGKASSNVNSYFPTRLANNKVMREINTDSEDYKYKI